MNQDITKPYTANRSSLYNLSETNESRNEKWTLNPQKNCPKEKHLPKIQQFKNYYFVKRNKNDVEKYQNNYLNTDNISIRVPDFVKNKIENNEINENQKNEEQKIKKMFRTPFLDMKKAFNVNTLSNSSWSPLSYNKTANNISSVDYNIITFRKGFNTNDTTNSSNIFDKKINYKKKSVCEFSDLTRDFAINLDKNFQNAYKENPKRFYSYNGVFTYLYDASHRNGNISMPFRKKNESLSPRRNQY